MRRAAQRRLGGLVLAAAVATSACDALLTDPAPPLSEVSVSFAVEGSATGGVADAFDRLNRAYLLFIRPDSARRDTIVRLNNKNGVARARLALETNERISALRVYAELRAGAATLFSGTRVIRIELGKPTSAEVPMSPVPAFIRPNRQQLTFQNVGDTTRLSSAVLFASGDTIPGIRGTWASERPDIVFVTQAGRAVARAVGETRLLVRYRELLDTIGARVLSGR